MGERFGVLGSSFKMARLTGVVGTVSSSMGSTFGVSGAVREAAVPDSSVNSRELLLSVVLTLLLC